MITGAGQAFLAERHALRSTLEELGPDAPTLIAGWKARDIAPHVASGELAAGVPVFIARLLVRRGIDVTFLQKAGARQQARLTDRGWDWALGRFARTPPRLVHHAAVAPVSLLEYWVHHEDVRRANGRGHEPARNYGALRGCVEIVARYVRKHLANTEIVVDDGDRLRLGRGARQITLRGPVGEALLWLTGRHAAAEVEVMGEGAADIAGRVRL